MACPRRFHVPDNLKPGETARFNCENCEAQFAVTLEPHADGMPLLGAEPAPVLFCPLCGSDLIEPLDNIGDS
jgi:hypothetical protein